MKTPKLVGSYTFGQRVVRLYVDGNKTGGTVEVIPADGGTPIVTIGLDDDWEAVVGTLFHEIFELALVDLNARYTHSPKYSFETGNFLFMFDHNQFDEMCERMAYFMTRALADFTKAYGQFRKEKKSGPNHLSQ